MLAWLGVGRCGLNSTKKNLSRRFFALSSVICHSLSFVARKIKINNARLPPPFPIPHSLLYARKEKSAEKAWRLLFNFQRSYARPLFVESAECD